MHGDIIFLHIENVKPHFSCRVVGSAVNAVSAVTMDACAHGQSQALRSCVQQHCCSRCAGRHLFSHKSCGRALAAALLCAFQEQSFVCSCRRWFLISAGLLVNRILNHENVRQCDFRRPRALRHRSCGLGRGRRARDDDGPARHGIRARETLQLSG